MAINLRDYLGEQRKAANGIHTNTRPLPSGVKPPRTINPNQISSLNSGAASPLQGGAQSIMDRFQGLQESALAKSRGATEQGVLTQQRTIDAAGEQFDPLRVSARAQQDQAVRAQRERLSNLGLSAAGSQSRTQQTKLQSNLLNRLADIDRSQQKVISDANFTIKQLESQGRFDEAGIIADYAAQQSQALLDDFYRERDYETQQEQFAQQKADNERNFEAQQKSEQFQNAVRLLDGGWITSAQFKAMTGQEVAQITRGGGGGGGGGAVNPTGSPWEEEEPDGIPYTGLKGSVGAINPNQIGGGNTALNKRTVSVSGASPFARNPTPFRF